MSEFRHRGVRVEVDTTEIAEWDAKSIQIGDEVMERIARNLKKVTISERDRVFGDVRVRLIEDFDVVFFLGRDEGTVIVTIGKIVVPSEDTPIDEMLKKVGFLAMLRGASGL